MTNLELLAELTESSHKARALQDEVELCYVDDCEETAVVEVFVEGYSEEEGWVQKCEGHARLHYDPEYQQLRIKWRRNGWGV